MAEMIEIVHLLKKGKNVSENLSRLSHYMMTESERLSQTRFALNYVTLYDTVVDHSDSNYPEFVHKILLDFNDLVSKNLDDSASIVDFLLFRKKIKIMTEQLSAYADAYTIYEYVLNRIEYLYQEKELPAGYTDLEMKNQLIRYFASLPEGSMNMGISRVLEQLPIRMTKGKFYETITECLSLYSGTDEKSFQSILTRLETESLQHTPRGMKELCPELEEVRLSMESISFENLDRVGYQRVLTQLQDGFSLLNDCMDVVLLIQGLVNDICILFYSKEDAIHDITQQEICDNIVKGILTLFQNEKNENIPDSLWEQCEHLEGIQEHCHDQLNVGSAYISGLEGEKAKIIVECGLEKVFLKISKIQLLSSTSLFTDLDEVNEEVSPATKEYIVNETKKFIQGLDKELAKHAKPTVRAIMAKILASLPLFLKSQSELEEYILNSLSSCTNQAEKIACVEIVSQIMRE